MPNRKAKYKKAHYIKKNIKSTKYKKAPNITKQLSIYKKIFFLINN